MRAGALAWGLVSLGLLGGACAGGGAAGTLVAPPAADPLWDAAAAALDDGDDALAEALVLRLRARAAAGDARGGERLALLERVLDGRRLARSVALRLVSEPTGEPGRHRVVLLARSEAPEPLVLRSPPARLGTLRVAVTPDGGLTREARTRPVAELERLELPPGRTTRRELALEEIPLGPAMAVRERWSLRLSSGTWETPAGELPATRIAVVPCERVRLAPELPPAPVAVEELVRYARAGRVRTASLLERAVRVASPRRQEALAALAPLVSEWAASEPERVLALAPALRWLCDEAWGGMQPAEWAAALAQETRARERPRLDVGAAGPPGS